MRYEILHTEEDGEGYIEERLIIIKDTGRKGILILTPDEIIFQNPSLRRFLMSKLKDINEGKFDKNPCDIHPYPYDLPTLF